MIEHLFSLCRHSRFNRFVIFLPPGRLMILFFCWRCLLFYEISNVYTHTFPMLSDVSDIHQPIEGRLWDPIDYLKIFKNPAGLNSTLLPNSSFRRSSVVFGTWSIYLSVSWCLILICADRLVVKSLCLGARKRISSQHVCKQVWRSMHLYKSQHIPLHKASFGSWKG